MVDYVQRAFDALADKMLEGRRIPDDTFAAFSALYAEKHLFYFPAHMMRFF